MKCGTLPVFTLFLSLFGFTVSTTAENARVAADQGFAGFTEKYMAANGGADKLQTVHSIRIEGVRTLKNGDSGEFVYLNRFPNLERSAWVGPKNFQLKRGFDGIRCWEYSCTFDGKGSLSLSAQKQMALFDWTVLDPKSCGASLELQPSESLGGESCVRVKATFANGVARDFWFEAATMRLARVVDTNSDGSQRFFVIDKSMKLDGIWFPQVMSEVDSGGAMVERVEVRDVQTNIGLLPNFAEPPNYPYGVENK